MEGAAGALTDNQTLLNHTFNRWKNTFGGRLDAGHTIGQMNLNGSLQQEITRGTSLDYSTFALLPMIQVAEIARHRGVDLYNYTLQDGRGMEKGIDYVAPYVANPLSWPHPQNPAYKGQQSALFEMAYLWKQKQTYKTAINKWGRPISDRWIMGQTTLTHAYGAYPWKVHGSIPPINGGIQVVIEAEAMTLQNYMVDNNAMNGTGIQINPSLSIPATGTAVMSFPGATGTYDITFHAVPENDGPPSVKLYVNRVKVLEEVYPVESGYFTPEFDRIQYIITAVTINKGDEIKIEGTSGGTAASGAFARVDKIVFDTQANAVRLGLSSRLIKHFLHPPSPPNDFSIQHIIENTKGVISFYN